MTIKAAVRGVFGHSVFNAGDRFTDRTGCSQVDGGMPSWEVCDKRPGGPSQKLLDILERKGLEVVL
jgi:hypothetical protein